MCLQGLGQLSLFLTDFALLKPGLFFIIMNYNISCSGGFEIWPVITILTAPVHTPHARVAANAVNASRITAEAEKCPAASFPNRVKKPTTDLLKISAGIIN
jgi:hypothetical protein